MERPTCGTCPFWEDDICGRFPPMPVWLEPTKEDESGHAFSLFPETDPDDWCGEHPDFPAYLEARRLDRRGEGA
jgi:hypothetical protein